MVQFRSRKTRSGRRIVYPIKPRLRRSRVQETVSSRSDKIHYWFEGTVKGKSVIASVFSNEIRVSVGNDRFTVPIHPPRKLSEQKAKDVIRRQLRRHFIWRDFVRKQRRSK